MMAIRKKKAKRKTKRKASPAKARAARKNGKKGGRPRVEINWEEFDKLCAIHCTLEELAGWFRCSVTTIEQAVKREKGMGFREYYAQKKSIGRASLRRVQMQKALGGDKTMLVWLGKQLLGQTDKRDIRADVDARVGVSSQAEVKFYYPVNGRDDDAD